MLESQPPIRFSEQLLGAEAQVNNTIFDKFCKYFIVFYPLSLAVARQLPLILKSRGAKCSRRNVTLTNKASLVKGKWHGFAVTEGFTAINQTASFRSSLQTKHKQPPIFVGGCFRFCLLTAIRRGMYLRCLLPDRL